MVALPEKNQNYPKGEKVFQKTYYRRKIKSKKKTKRNTTTTKKNTLIYLQPFTILGNLPMDIVTKYAIYEI